MSEYVDYCSWRIEPERGHQNIQMRGPILLVDDDSESNGRLSEFFSGNGYTVVSETNGRRGADLIKVLNPILVIMDLTLPDMDGLSICREVRAVYSGPIIIMTTLSDDIDEVASLETGADEYLNKPIEPRVLLAHIRALLRRSPAYRGESAYPGYGVQIPGNLSAQSGSGELKVGRLCISMGSRTVLKDGKACRMTSGEFDTIWYLASNAGKVVSRDELHRRLRGTEYDGIDRSVDQHISNIRKKLGDNPRAPTFIKSIRGVGYLLAS